LAQRGNGLVVKGRGAVHQVDVLGELKWIPAFMYPLRLIVEAKFRQEKTGIDVVRNAVSVLLDVNQNNSPTREQETFYPKYQYVYAIFSTSGFTRPAMDMAIAHQISFVDLSGIEYDQLKNAIGQSADEILRVIQEIREIQRGKLISNLRYVIRRDLGTLPNIGDLNFSFNAGINYDMFSEGLRNTLNVTREYNELFVGMANGPFMILLKANDPRNFLQYSKDSPIHTVIITWPYPEDGGREWKVRPASDNDAYELSFKLPERLYKWIFETEKERKSILSRALSAKHQYFSRITIYRYENERDYLFRLKFDPEATNNYVERQR